MKKFFNIDEVSEETGLSKSTIQRQIAAEKFPKAVRISKHRIAWKHEDLEKWYEQLEVA